VATAERLNGFELANARLGALDAFRAHQARAERLRCACALRVQLALGVRFVELATAFLGFLCHDFDEMRNQPRARNCTTTLGATTLGTPTLGHD
jgi:hypothetical protein